MDISTFNKDNKNCFGSECTHYSKVIGNYILHIFLGNWDLTISSPMDGKLNIKEYKILPICVDSIKDCKIIQLSKIEVEDIPLVPGSKTFYNAKFSDVEKVYNKLCDINKVKD